MSTSHPSSHISMSFIFIFMAFNIVPIIPRFPASILFSAVN